MPHFYVLEYPNTRVLFDSLEDREAEAAAPLEALPVVRYDAEPWTVPEDRDHIAVYEIDLEDDPR